MSDITTKKCNRCGDVKSTNSFYNKKIYKDGLHCWCKDCCREYHKSDDQRQKRIIRDKEYYSRPEIKETLREKWNAREYDDNCKCRKKLQTAIKTGKIKKRNICEYCYSSPTQCHHDDYSMPFSFIEMCQSCHSLLHGKYNLITK